MQQPPLLPEETLSRVLRLAKFDGLGALGLARSAAFQVAMAMFLVCCIAAYGWFLRAAGHNRPA